MGRACVALGIAIGGLAACGRIGFESAGDAGRLGDDALPADATGSTPGLGALSCGTSLVIARLDDVPLGLGLVSTSAGAIAVWTQGSPVVATTALTGVRLVLEGDRVTAATPVGALLPDPIADFGLVGDGDRRFLLSGQVGTSARYVALDANLQPSGSRVATGIAITPHGVAEPLVPGGPFIAGWVEAGEARFAQLSASGAAVPPVLRQPAGLDVAVRHADARAVISWTTSDATGCAVWALDDSFTPLIAAPLVHAPAGPCQRSAITRDEVGVNFLMWIAGGVAHAQLGTDTDTVGNDLALGAPADELEITTAPAGFFYAFASRGKVQPGHVSVDGTRLRALDGVPHVPDTAIRMVAHGAGALLLSVATPANQAELWLTRLCEPATVAQ